ncbi:hypothetical protein LJC41_05975 [Desulfosarcina sp. OttesenSCG-928-G17]|nr:hypothetical protein [Desulfosarcina sp. OttesenSCG-928-G17]
MKTIRTLTVLLPLICLVFASPAWAHKVSVFAWVEADTVYTESKFSDGKRVKGGTVSVFDSQGQLLVEGRTDDKGGFSFKPSRPCDLRIVMNAGMGHQNTWTLAASEFHESAVSTKLPIPAADPETRKPAPLSIGEPTSLTAETVEAIVARQLDEKLQPLTRMMVQATDKDPSFRDILGGIGYIVGLVGVGAYLRYRKEARKP